MLLHIKAAQIDLLLIVPDVCLPPLGAPAMHGMEHISQALLQPEIAKEGRGEFSCFWRQYCDKSALHQHKNHCCKRAETVGGRSSLH